MTHTSGMVWTRKVSVLAKPMALKMRAIIAHMGVIVILWP